MMSLIPDINKGGIADDIKLVIAVLECFPGKEYVRVILTDYPYDIYELKQKVNIDVDLLELLYAIEGIEVSLE